MPVIHELFIHIFMKKEEIEKKKSLARALYLSGMEQKEIADKVGVSAVTVSKWCTEGKWKEARAAKNITRPELVNKLLLTIDKLIEQVNTSEDATMIAGLGDQAGKTLGGHRETRQEGKRGGRHRGIHGILQMA